MSTLLRILLLCLGVVVVMIAIIAVALFVIIDPDDYRNRLEQAFNESTGLDLEIAGGIAVTWRPYVGLTLDDVRLRNPNRPQELASSSSVRLRVDSRELLSGRLLLEELSADDLHLNLYVDAEGNPLWMTDRLRRRQARGPASNTEDGASITTNFSSVSIDNASIDIQNLEQGYYYTVHELNLDSQASNLGGRSFPVQARFQLETPTAPVPWPVTLSSDVNIDLDSGNLRFSAAQLVLSPARLEGELSLQNLYGDSSWQVQLSSSEFPLNDLIENLFTSPEARQTPQLPRVSQDRAWQARIDASLSGDQAGTELSELVATLGDLRLEMTGDVRFANGLLPTNARFNVATGGLDLSPYLAFSAGDSPVESVAPALDPQGGALPPGSNPNDAADPDPRRSLLDLQIPATLRSGMNVQGSVSLDSLFLGGIQFGSVNLYANLESGVLDLELQPTAVLDGTVEGTLRINSIPARSEVALDLYATSLSMAELPLPLVLPGTFSGRLSQESHYLGSGTTLGEWLQGVSGATSFAVNDGTVDIGVIKQVFTSIAVLSPRGETIQTWPDVVRTNQFSGFAILENGLDNQQIKVRLDNFDITGSGAVDPAARRFDYDLLFTVLGEPFAQIIPIDQRYHNVSWPVECAAGFDEPVNRFCRPDLVQVRSLFSQLDNNTLTTRLDVVMPEQAPEALQNFNRGLLQNLLPMPAQEAEQQLSPDQSTLLQRGNLPPGF